MIDHGPQRRGTSQTFALPEALARLLLTGIATAVRALYRLELSLARRSSAEYLADQEAARVASRDATLSLMEKLLLADSCQFALQGAIRRGERDLWSAIRRDMEVMPARERDRLRRKAARRGHRIDETHPPTALRIEVLTAGPDGDAPIVLVDGCWGGTTGVGVVRW